MNMMAISVLKWAITLFLAFFLILLGLFIHSEQERSKLLSSYAAPLGLIKYLQNVRKKNAIEILQEDEAVLCTLGSYGDVRYLQSLNDQQKTSIGSNKLPKEDGTWYLLIFEKDKISRIFIFNIYGDYGLILEGSTCADRHGFIVVSKNPSSTQFSIKVKQND